MALFPKTMLVRKNASADFARNKFVLLFTLFGLTFLVACGDSGSSSTPPEQSSSTFGTSSLNGTYVFSSTGLDLSNGSLLVTMAGSLTANGSGGITGGTVDLIGGNLAYPLRQLSRSPGAPIASAPTAGDKLNLTPPPVPEPSRLRWISF